LATKTLSRGFVLSHSTFHLVYLFINYNAIQHSKQLWCQVIQINIGLSGRLCMHEIKQKV